MYSFLNDRLKKKAIEKALIRPSPSRIPLDRERAQNLDCFTTKLKGEGENAVDLIVKKLSEDHVIGMQWSGKAYEDETRIPLEELVYLDLRITHYFKHVRTEYFDAIDFFWGQITQKPKLFLLRNRIAQSLYNQTTRFRQDRMELLKEIYSNHLKNAGNSEEQLAAIFGADEGFTAMQLFTDLYGERAFDHPSFNREYTAFKLLLDSLHATGDLRSENDRYSLAPSSLKSIADFEETERRHADSVRQNKRLFWITVVIALATAVQAYTAFSIE